jgi:hypothetical protein
VQSPLVWLNKTDNIGTAARIRVLNKFDDADIKMKVRRQTEVIL